MQLPALAIQQPDLGRTLAQVAAIKGQGLQNKLLESQIAKEGQLSGLRSKMLGGDNTYNALAAGGGPTNEAAAMMDNAPSGGINSDLMKRYLALDPKGGAAIMDALNKMDTQQREKFKETSGMAAKLGLWIESAGSPQEKQMRYVRALAQARQMGIPVQGAPQAYDPSFVHRQIALGMALNEPEAPSGFQRTAEGLAPFEGGPGDPAYQAQLAEAKTAATPQYSGEVLLDKQVGKWYQINPKTGKREYISPNEEFTIESDGKGGFRIRKGTDTGGGDTTTAQRGKIQEKIRDSLEAATRLTNIQAKFKPEFQQIPTRLGTAWTGLKAKLGRGEITPEDRVLLEDFSSYKQEALTNLNLYIKETTGAQMSEGEASRLRKAMPDPGEGVLDGDDPISFKSKLDNAISMAQKAAIRHAYYLKRGMTANVYEMATKTPLDSMEFGVDKNTGARTHVKIDGKWLPLSELAEDVK